ncbi:uncharacterized protein LOC116601971 [Nematostella vectensis]|uniref:uncharacterized protein LOC116601971 n=1 Tax=Nematostella vectensis TaxID=45351 RepID=UPI0013904751|nr:uncharacterized protein LOC116601971 [Nematostella vectensis]
MSGQLVLKKKVRGAHRGAATKLIRKVNEILDLEEHSEDEKLAIRQHRDSAKEKAETVRALDDEVIELSAEKEDSEELEAIITEGDEMRARLHEVIHGMEGLMALWDQAASPAISPASLPSSPARSSTSTEARVRARLPEVEVPKFGGKIQEWPEFWDSFESAIDSNGALADVDKFAYLKGLLVDEAKHTIAGFAMTAANYGAAIGILRKRYGKTEAIQRSHINDLLNLSPVFNDGDLTRLRRFYDVAETHFRGLEALNVNETSYSGIVVPALLQKLLNSFRLTTTRGYQNFMSWSMERLLAEIRAEVELREEHKPISSEASNKKPQDGMQRQTSGSALFVEANGQGERKKILVKYARCFRCLRKNHRSYECKSKDSNCKGCAGAHHLSICENQASGQTETPQQERGESEQAGEASSNHVTSGFAESFHVGSGTRIALQTAQGIVSWEGGVSARTRFLFDAGSHRSFITASAARKAKLPVVRREWLCINAFGQRYQKGTLREVVELNVSPVNGGASINVQAFVVP